MHAMTHKPTSKPAALLAAVLCLAPLAANAQFMGRSADDVVEVTFLEGWRISGDRHMAGIRIDLAPGWKTYWRAPGEGGVPTQLRLTEVEGITGLAIHWPSPEVFQSNGMRSIGYLGDVVLPVELVLDGSGSYSLDGHLDFGVCQDICMPVSLSLSGTFTSDGTRDPLIGAALSDRPLSAAEAGAGAVRCTVEPISDGLRVQVSADLASTGYDETMVVEHSDPTIWVSDAATRRVGDQVFGTVDVVPQDHGPFALSRSDLRITVIGTRVAVDLGGCTG